MEKLSALRLSSLANHCVIARTRRNVFLAGILKGSVRDIWVAFKKTKEEKSLVLATRNEGSSEKGLSRTHAVTTYKDTEEWHI